MARPDQVNLTITSRAGSETSTVTVTYLARFNQADVNGNLRYQERIQLRGEDPPPGPGGDNTLFAFPARTVRPDGQRTRSITRTAEVSNSRLDEDRGALEDEIYAQVCLSRTGSLRRCASSEIISQLVAEETGS